MANNVVEYRPTVAGNPLVIEGREANYVPGERFPDFLDLMKVEVAEGRLDKEIEAAAGGTGTATKTPRVKREPGAGGGTREWSPERRAKFAATVANRKAAKAGGN